MFLSLGGWEGFKNLKIAKKEAESSEITSFYLVDPAGGPLPDFQPGQFLSFRIPAGTIAGWDHDIVRNYSLSSRPGQNFYRISVKREAGSQAPPGVVSNYFHDQVKVGDEVLVSVTYMPAVFHTNS